MGRLRNRRQPEIGHKSPVTAHKNTIIPSTIIRKEEDEEGGHCPQCFQRLLLTETSTDSLAKRAVFLLPPRLLGGTDFCYLRLP